jgi:membrane protease YdiL (CAAX protease family)
MLLLAGLVLALGVWAFLFLPPRESLWPRTWVAALVLGTFAVVALARSGRLDDVVGPVGWAQVGLGLAVGVGWLLATQVGHQVLCRMFPSFLARVNDLYAIRDRHRLWLGVGAVTAMGAAEELFFRGFVQDRAGLVAAVAAYTGVQVVARNWALALAAALCGSVWGLLAWASGGMVAPVAAHVVWVVALTFVWPLRGCHAPDPVEEAVARTRAPVPPAEPSPLPPAPLEDVR